MSVVRTDHGEAGFSLIEMLVALALLAGLMTLLITGIGGLRVVSEITQRAGRDDSVAAAAYMRRALSQLRALPLASATSGRAVIEARGNTLSFVTAFAPAGGYGGLAQVTWSLVAGSRPDTFHLQEARTVYRSVAAATSPPQIQVLVRDLAGISFAYQALAGSGGRAAEWTTPDRLPGLVSVGVVFPANDGRRWLPLDVAIPTVVALER